MLVLYIYYNLCQALLASDANDLQSCVKNPRRRLKTHVDTVAQFAVPVSHETKFNGVEQKIFTKSN
jgi:hypothetical protein